jgi:hypothetical protein
MLTLPSNGKDRIGKERRNAPEQSSFNKTEPESFRRREGQGSVVSRFDRRAPKEDTWHVEDFS